MNIGKVEFVIGFEVGAMNMHSDGKITFVNVFNLTTFNAWVNNRGNCMHNKQIIEQKMRVTMTNRNTNVAKSTQIKCLAL